MRRALQSLVDERLVMSIVVLNAVVLFLRAYERWEDVSILFAIDYACTVYFVFEMVTKMGLLGGRRFFDTGWNRFDFLIVAASSPHLLAPVLDSQDFAVLLVLRTVRLVRMLRLLHFIPDRDRLWHGMLRALRASVGVAFALVLYNFVLGLSACYLFRHTGSAHFADPLTSVYSLFKVFTVEGWYEVPDTVAASAGPGMAAFVRGFFVFAVLTGGILGLSLANAVFVDEMVLDNTDEIERHIVELRSELALAREEGARNAADLKRVVDELSARLGGRGPPDAGP